MLFRSFFDWSISSSNVFYFPYHACAVSSGLLWLLEFITVLILKFKMELSYLEFCRVFIIEETCLIASLSIQGMALWGFSLEKEPPATEEKVFFFLSSLNLFS